MSEMHLCGVLVHARREQTGAVRTRLERLAGVEVHADTPDGRLVITVEDTPQRHCIDTISDIRDLEGVLGASLVYQHTDTGEPEEESQL
jgi:nitrate reductase NapD